MNMVESQPNPPAFRRRWYQFRLRMLLVFVSVVTVLCSIGVCTHWVVPIGLSAIAVSVTLLATVTARVNTALARITVVAAQVLGVGVNLIHLIHALLGALVGLLGTDTSAHFDNLLVLIGFSCTVVAFINCLALLVSRQAFFQILLPIAAVGNCITFALAILAITYPRLDVIGGVPSSTIFYSLTFISINAIAVRVTYRVRFNEGTRGSEKGTSLILTD